MNILRYQLSFSGKQKNFQSEVEFYVELKELRNNGIRVTPLVLVEGVPDKVEPVWMRLNEYKKLLKEENYGS